MESSKRNPNFTNDEKIILIDIIDKYKNIIENKTSNKFSLHDKEKTWYKILKEFNKQFRDKRHLKSLQNMWNNLKREARKHFGDLKRETYLTGGGVSKIKCNIIYEKVYNIISLSIDGLYNSFDNDSYHFSNSTNSALENVGVTAEENSIHPEKATSIHPEKETSIHPDENPDDPVFQLSNPLKTKIDKELVQKNEAAKEENNNEESRSDLVKAQSELANAMKEKLLKQECIEEKILQMKYKNELLKRKILKIKYKKLSSQNGSPFSSDSENNVP
ncbi:myb/SANT-like DNA-binding domain-containing protein 3 [Prorops nasuta]|uniref:myb/SANT-like DNA-binding domain-containing protein 3 n=1 Tax=Prorops nasuta TaxID=863751 RepID=UPI0034CDBF01